MKLATIIAQLRAHCPTFENRVGGAAEFAAARTSTALAVPCAFVIPLDDNPERNTHANGLRQELIEAFGVAVAVSNELDEKGQGAVDKVDDLRTEIWAALLNWPPGENYDGLQYQAGTLVQIDRSRLWWQFEFGARTEITEEDGYTPAHPHFEGMTVNVDQIDPAADRNVQYPGPDGRIETELRINDLPT